MAYSSDDKPYMYLLLLFPIFLLAQTVEQNTPEFNSYVWGKVHSGEYRITDPSEEGVVTVTAGDLILNVPVDYSQLVKTFDYLEPDTSYDLCYSDDEKQEDPFLYKSNISCGTLNEEPELYDEELLFKCLNYLRKKIAPFEPLTRNNRDTIFANLFALPKEQRDFLGFILTGFGEARSSSNEEVAMVFKTLENRKDYAIRRGCLNATVLDTALQHKQFSMWNKNDPNWKKAVSLKAEESKESEGLKRIISVFSKYKQGKFKFQGRNNLNRVYHYRTTNSRLIPEWGPRNRSLADVRVNNVGLGRDARSKEHYFFQSVAWSFAYHPIRKKEEGEDKCY